MNVIELRFLIPMIIAISFCADVGLRFVPPGRIAHRAWEAVSVFPGAGPFAPNLVYDNDRAYGDLPGLANRPSLRVYRREYFTTDAFGFRNTPNPQNRPIKIIIVGDSFTAGSGVSDSDTLSAQLAELGQTGVYNAGATWTWTAVEQIIQRLHLKGGLIVWQISERSDVPLETGEKFEVRILRSLLPADSQYEKARIALRVAQGFYRYSPLQILLTRMFEVLQDDHWLPNVSAGSVLVKRLGNGQEMGFFTGEVDNFGRERPTTPDYFVGLQSAVRATGNQMAVIMIPDKYNVYYPLLEGSPAAPPEEDSMLGRLAQNLHAKEVPALDLTPAFRRQAALALPKGEYLYLMDDTHLNPTGSRIVAGELLNFLRASDLYTSSTHAH